MSRGAYLLLLELGEEIEVEVGRLGTLRLAPGRYLYTGSALNGLEPRLRRHFRREKTKRWHIDHITCLVTPRMALALPSDVRLECELNALVSSLRGAETVAKGFGVSDCRCSSHLHRVSSATIELLISLLGRERIVLSGDL